MDTRTRSIRQLSTSVRLILVALMAFVAGGVVVGSGVIRAVTDQSQPSAFVAIDSYRTLDSRVAPWGSKLVPNFAHTVKPMFDVSDGVPFQFPEGTVAVAYNLTVTETEGAGFVTIDALPLTEASTSNVNWSGQGQTVANSGITRVKTGDDDTLEFGVRLGGTPDALAHVVIDITGYFIEI